MEKNKRIIHIAAYYPPHLGGLERVVKMCAEGLSVRGYEVQVITTTQSGLKRGTYKEGNLTTKVLSSIEFAHVAIAPKFIWEMFTLPKDALLHLHLAHAFFPEIMLSIAKLRGIKYVAHFHLDVEPSGFFGPLFVIYKNIVWKLLLSNATHIISCAQDQVAIMEKKFGIQKEKITVIPNAVSADFFADRTFTPPKEKLRILSIGRLAPQKRVERMVEAMKEITIPADLTIVGDGESRNTLEQLVREFSLNNVRFVGKKNDKEMQQLIQNHDVFLITSEKEGMPLAVLEAMAGGLPIVSTRVEGLTEMIEGTGILVEEPYGENCARTLETLWENPEKLRVLSEQSKQKAQKYGWETFIDAIIAVYQHSV